MLKSPCNGCAERVLGCHDKCPKYGAFAAERRSIYAERAQQVFIGDTFAGYQRDKRERLAKRKNHS